MTDYIGRAGYAGGYRVEIGEDRLVVIKDDVVVAEQPVPLRDGLSIGRFAAAAQDLRIGWGRLPTGDEVVAVYDGREPRHGFVVNLTDPGLSGWGEPPTTMTSAAVGDPDRPRPK